MAILIDPANKRLVLDSAAVTAQAIYVAWADWVALSDNGKYLPAFSSVGGDALGGGLFIPPYYFLLNGWRVRPMESDHTLTLTGNLFVEGGGDPVVKTLGEYNVLVKSIVPVQAQGISTSGTTGPSTEEIAAAVPSAEDIAAAVLASLNAALIPVNTAQMNGAAIIGDGTESNPWRGVGVQP